MTRVDGKRSATARGAKRPLNLIHRSKVPKSIPARVAAGFAFQLRRVSAELLEEARWTSWEFEQGVMERAAAEVERIALDMQMQGVYERTT